MQEMLLDEVSTPQKIFAPFKQPQPIRVLIDVRSQHSDGAHDLNTLIQLAQQRGIQALAFNEHDRFSIRLGIEPIPSLLGYSQEHPSLYETGLEPFFEDIKHAQSQTNLTLLAGTESTPGYTWQGLPFVDLQLNQAERHFITLGVKSSQQIQGLSSYKLSYGYGSLALSYIFWGMLLALAGIIWLRQHKRWATVLFSISLSSILFISLENTRGADEAFLESAQEQNLFVIWAHPGTLSGVRKGPMGVLLNTPPYNRQAFKMPAHAFAAVYGDTDNNTAPGGLWDRYMMAYLKGYKSQPIWGVAAGDFHEEGGANEYLGNFPMDVWATSNQKADILDALKHGRMASWHMNKEQNFQLNQYYLSYLDKGSSTHFITAGEEAVISPDILLTLAFSQLNKENNDLTLHGQWIVDGKIAKRILINMNDSSPHTVNMHLPKGKHVIRFQIPSQHGVRLETNPFLVEVRNK
jgi:hypothetical protein